jgi:hypothetical protein
VRHIFGKEFQSDGAVETSVLRFVDHTHAPTPEFFEDAVMGNSLVEWRLGIRHFAGMLGSLGRHVNVRRNSCGETRRCAGLNLATKGEP